MPNVPGRTGLRVSAAVVALMLVGLVARKAYAQTTGCSSLLPFCFAPDAPALAGEVNANFKKVADFTVPAGGIMMFTGSTAPAGWALCVGGTAAGSDGGTVVVGQSVLEPPSRTSRRTTRWRSS